MIYRDVFALSLYMVSHNVALALIAHKGIVEKTKSNDDKRTTILTLTTAGNKETNRLIKLTI
jgi:hypothetical protein